MVCKYSHLLLSVIAVYIDINRLHIKISCESGLEVIFVNGLSQILGLTFEYKYGSS